MTKTKTKIIQLKKSNKKGIYKDILSDTEKIKEILKKKKKTNKNYEYLNNNLLFDKNNNVLNLPQKSSNPKLNQNIKNKQPIYKKKIKKSNNSLNINKTQVFNEKKIPKQINISLSKKKTLNKKKYKPSKIRDYFNKKKKLTKNTNDIKNKVLKMLKNVISQKNNLILFKFIKNLNLISTKLIATYLNLTINADKLSVKFLKKLIYMSLCNNIIIFKLS